MRKLKHLSSYSLLFIAAIIFIFLFGGIVFPSVQPQVVEAQTVSTCLNRVNIPTSDLHWAYVPETADQLTLKKILLPGGTVDCQWGCGRKHLSF